MMGKQNVECNSLKPAFSAERVCDQICHSGLTLCLYNREEKRLIDEPERLGIWKLFLLRFIGAGQYVVGLARGDGGIVALSD